MKPTKTPVGQQPGRGATIRLVARLKRGNSILSDRPQKRESVAMANTLKREKQIEVLRHLVEGNTLRSTSRLTGVHRTTIQNLLVSFGSACQEFMDRELRGLTLKHVEVDEVWTFVQKKQSRLTLDERALRSDIGDVYLWTALDADTKLIASHLVGKRSADNARRLMNDLARRLAMPKAYASDPQSYKRPGYLKITQLSTDGFSAYPEAVDLAFGPYVKFGTIVKDYRNANLPYEPSEMVGTKRTGIFGIGEHELNAICTSHVERHNLTIRTLLKRFTRLSLGFSKKLENLEAACSMFMAVYNWTWRTRDALNGRHRLPAAMLAGVTDRLWSFGDLFDAIQ
jgi:IS1 family transposase